MTFKLPFYAFFTQYLSYALQLIWVILLASYVLYENNDGPVSRHQTQAKVETKRPLYPLKLLTRELRAKKIQWKTDNIHKRYLFDALDILDLFKKTKPKKISFLLLQNWVLFPKLCLKIAFFYNAFKLRLKYKNKVTHSKLVT